MPGFEVDTEALNGASSQVLGISDELYKIGLEATAMMDSIDALVYSGQGGKPDTTPADLLYTRVHIVVRDLAIAYTTAAKGYDTTDEISAQWVQLWR